MRIAKALLVLAENAKEASKRMRLAPVKQKNRALLAIADELEKSQETILKANAQDLKAADLSEAMRDRLSLTGRLEGMIADVRKIAKLSDPVGEIIEKTDLENGLRLQKKRVPIGVIGVIYEARPNVTVDIASLALKTGNCAILRGGKETLCTNRALVQAIQSALVNSYLPREAVQLIKSPRRSQVKQLVKLDHLIDMIIPRGGEELHRFCKKESTIPVITGGIGICHLFVDEIVDLEKAVEVVFNAKTQRPSVCNALDTLLVHKRIAQKFLPAVALRLQAKGVSFRLDPQAWDILQMQQGSFQKAREEDWQTEWLSLILGIKVVASLKEAIAHIQKYSTNHSDGILTNSQENAYAFAEAIDSGAVYINASTRFTDGGQFGLGAEVAVSTQKLHARGPMGLKELTTYKWIVEGNYHVRINSG
jgi:glutamate-5-semialdehyde dehydrogenase